MRHSQIDAIDIAFACAMGLVAIALLLIRMGMPS